MRLQRDTLLGLVFFGGLAGLGWATVQLTDLSLFGEEEEQTVYFENALGLAKGDPVFLLGTRRGEVGEVALVPDHEPPIKVVLKLDERIPFTSALKIEIRDSSFLGGKQINISAKSGPPSDPLVGIGRPNILESLGDEDVGGLIDSVRTFFDKLVDSEGSVGALLDSRDLYDDLAAAIKSARRSIEELERGEGTLGQAIYGRELADDFSVAVHQLREIMEKVNEGSGVAARVINDSDMADNLGEAVADIRAMTGAARRGEGVFGRLLSNPDLAAKFDEITESLRSAMAKIDDPNAGVLGAAIGDPKMRENAQEMMANLAEFTGKINDGDGMIGRLVNDSELGDKLDQLITQVTGAVEDAREAAPVSTFFQVIAAPF